VGWFADRKEAERAVLSNATDIFEMNYYDRAVIEQYAEGFCQVAMNRWWYKATYAKENPDPVVTKVREPKWAKKIINIGFG